MTENYEPDLFARGDEDTEPIPDQKNPRRGIPEKTFMSNKQYDTLRWSAQIILPAIGTLYFALSGIWGFPKTEEIVGTVTAIVTFMGVVLGISSKAYNSGEPVVDGYMNVKDDGEGLSFLLELQTDPEDLKDQNTISFKVNKSQ